MKFFKVTCPKCGYEYAADEILYPKYMLGNYKQLIRNEAGKIVEVIGSEEPALEEDWECENCHCNFKVKVDIHLKVDYDPNLDFSNEDYSIKI